MLAPVDAWSRRWTSAFKQDPFEVPLDDKIAVPAEAERGGAGAPGVSFVSSQMLFVDEQKYFASTDGSRIDAAPRPRPIRSSTSPPSDRADRRLPDARGRSAARRRAATSTSRTIRGKPRREQAGDEVVEKLKAKPVAPGRYDLVVDPSQLWLAIHESVGHSTELDRALGWEANMPAPASSSPTRRRQAALRRAASSTWSPTARSPAASRPPAYDDEGVKAERWHLVRDGMFVDWQTTRELAPLVGQKRSHGCLHADSWASVPFPRMPNVSLRAGAPRTCRSTSSFSGIEARDVHRRARQLVDRSAALQLPVRRRRSFCEITNGKLGGMVRDVAYQSRTPDFWASCDGLGGPATYRLRGTFADGKGEPGQTNAVSHGCPPARFRQITVLNTSVSMT